MAKASRSARSRTGSSPASTSASPSSRKRWSRRARPCKRPCSNVSRRGKAIPGEERDADIRLRELEREGSARDQLYTNLVRRQKELRYQQEIVAIGCAHPVARLASGSAELAEPACFSSSRPSCCFRWAGASWPSPRNGSTAGLRSEQEVVEALGLPCLGLVSQLSRTARIRPHKYLLRHPYSAYTEAIRSVVAGLRLTTPHEASKIILTSSSVPSEGKTTLAVSLAVYIAQIRRRVLLVDLDFRHPTVQRALRTRAKRGVVDLLLHDLPPADVIQRVPHLGLDYLPMTRCPVDPGHAVRGRSIVALAASASRKL